MYDFDAEDLKTLIERFDREDFDPDGASIDLPTGWARGTDASGVSLHGLTAAIGFGIVFADSLPGPGS